MASGDGEDSGRDLGRDPDQGAVDRGQQLFASEELSLDAFLCGRLHLWQPLKGYRAATDPVLLAAACPARPGQSVLDLGCGAGAAALCLGARVPGLSLHGLELQPAYAELARRNGTQNAIALSVHEGDLRQMPVALRRDFDQVILNPPYYPKAGTPSPRAGRALAMQVADVPLAHWIEAAARRARPGGWITAIFLAEDLPEVLGALAPRLGSARLLPLCPRQGRPASRVLLQARKGGKAGLTLLPPLVIHQGSSHSGDREDYTPAANAILRQGAALDWAFSPSG